MWTQDAWPSLRAPSDHRGREKPCKRHPRRLPPAMAVGLGPVQVNLDEGPFWAKLIPESIKYKGCDGALNGNFFSVS